MERENAGVSRVDPDEKKEDKKEDELKKKKDELSEIDSNGEKKQNGAEEKDDDAKSEDTKKNKARDLQKKAVMSQSAANTANLAYSVMKLVQFLQMLGAMLAQAVGSVVGGFIGAIIAFGQAVAGFVTTVVSTIAGVLGVSAMVAGAIAGSVVTGVTVVTIGVVVPVVTNTNHLDEAPIIDCNHELKRVQIKDIDVDSETLTNAQKAYSVFKAYGLNDESIAGILGNWSVESGIDPTGIEGIYNEPFNPFGDSKVEAMDNYDSHVEYLFSTYAKMGLKIHEEGYMADDGVRYPGLGLGQWTGENARRLIATSEGVAKSDGESVFWYELDYQLAYALSDNYRPGFFVKWKEKPSQSVDEATMYFTKHWEGNVSMMIAERKKAAKEWFSLMSTWSIDEEYAISVLTMASQLGLSATDSNVKKVFSKCRKVQKYDNSSLAMAAVSYAYPLKVMGHANNGTPLYQSLMKQIFPGDPYFQSCDRGIAVAIRWSGADLKFPPGGAPFQLIYLKSKKEKWQFVGRADKLTMDDLAPGDIFAVPGHVFMYVGYEAIQKIHGDKANMSFNSVSASFGERSPGCGNDATSIIENRSGQDWTSNHIYEVYRLVKPDKVNPHSDKGANTNKK